MTMKADPKVIERARKLLAMTTANGCTAAEAAEAMAKVAKLMAEHNLTAWNLQRFGVAAPAEFGAAPVCDGEPFETPYLTPIIDRCFEVYVVAIRNDGRAEGVVIFGDETNVSLAISAWNLLRSTFIGLFDRAVAQRRAGQHERHTFYHGLRQGFIDRLDYDAKLAKLTNSPGTRLAMLKSKLAEEAGKAFPGMKITRHAGAAGDAFDAGYAASRELSLSQRVGAHHAPALNG